MRDNLQNIFDEYAQGLIDGHGLSKLVSYSLYLTELDQEYHENKIKQRIMDYKYTTLRQQTTLTPEEIVVKTEMNVEIMGMMKFVRSLIGDKRSQLLSLYVSGYSFRQIAEMLKVEYNDVFKQFEIIRAIIKRFLKSFPEYKDNILNKTILYPDESTKEAQPPTVQGYPHELLKQVSVYGEWEKKNGRTSYERKEICLVPEYLKESLGEDSCCLLCDECSRLEDNIGKREAENAQV